jgi:RNA polymerase sigma-70 factor (ECF subfamily)
LNAALTFPGSRGSVYGVIVRTPEDFDALYRDVGPRLWRAIYVYAAGRRDIADDAVAEAFARALERADSVRSPEPWLYRTAFRLAAAELRRSAKQIATPDGVVEQIDPGMDDLVKALRQLSPAQRAAMVLHYEADLSVAEVARRMGSTNGAVRVHLHMGRSRLRSILGSQEV